MEIAYTLTQLDFANTGHLEYPAATVLIRPEGTALLAPPVIKLQFRINAPESGGSLAALGPAALAQARALVPESAALQHLLPLVEQDLKEDAERQAANDAALLAALNGARTPSDG